MLDHGMRGAHGWEGGHVRHSLVLPLTPTLSPLAGRGESDRLGADDRDHTAPCSRASSDARSSVVDPDLLAAPCLGKPLLNPGIGSATLDAVEIGSGTRLLDVGTGPGYAAAQAAERGATVVGLDRVEQLVQALAA